MQFALPKDGRGYVTESGELILCLNGTDKRTFGHFENSSDGTCYFVYQPEPLSIPEELHSLDEEISKDLLAFAVKLGYFFNKYPNYQYSRDHDWDVLEHNNYRQLHTPLVKAGFRVEPHSTC